MGHYTHSCGNGDAKVTCKNLSNICFSSSIFLTESNAQWIIDLVATDHVAKGPGVLRGVPAGFQRVRSGYM